MSDTPYEDVAKWPPPTTKAKQRVHLDALLALLQIAMDNDDWDAVFAAYNALVALRAQMHNRSPVKVPRATGAPMTAALRQRIRELAKADPRRSAQDIAQAEHISIGRVSETLRGKRT
jgi:outer membrane biogenesis lipoprotein LolB